MRKATGFLKMVVRRAVLLGFGVEILLGLCWLAGNIMRYQDFGDSMLYRQAAENMICDDYMAILYPFLIRVATCLAGLFSIPFYPIMYVLQLACAMAAAYFFFSRLLSRNLEGRRGYCLFGSLALLTVPMAMQCHLAILPNSLVSSIVLVQLGFLVSLIRSEAEDAVDHEKSIRFSGSSAFMGFTWLAEALLLPEFLEIGAVIILCFFVIIACKIRRDNLRAMAHVILVIAACGGILVTVKGITTTPGAFGRMYNTPEAAAFRRFAWDNFGELYASWPQEFKDVLTQDDIANCNWYPQEKMWILWERVDRIYGKEHAKKLYGQLAKDAARIRMKRNVKEVLCDMLSYGLAPAAQIYLMEGRGQMTVSGNNYDMMRKGQPGLSGTYFRYGCYWFATAIMLLVIYRILLWTERFGRNNQYSGDMKDIKQTKKIIATFLACGVAIALWYTMQGGGMMDYKSCVPVTLLWCVALLLMGAKEEWTI